MNYLNLIFALFISPFAFVSINFLINRIIRKIKCTETAQGKVEDIVTIRTKNGSNYKLRIRFGARGEETVADSLPMNMIDVEEDSEIEVHYDPNNPRRIYLDQESSVGGFIFTGIIALVSTFLIVALIIGAF